jgi:hypothetical protein
MNLCAMAQMTCPMCGSRFRLVRFLTNALVLQEQEVANGAGVTLTPIGRERLSRRILI